MVGALPAPKLCSTTPWIGSLKKLAIVSTWSPGKRRSSTTCCDMRVWARKGCSCLGFRIREVLRLIVMPAVPSGGRFGESKACSDEFDNFDTRLPRKSVDEKNSVTSGIG